jgi:hypothetical protein
MKNWVAAGIFALAFGVSGSALAAGKQDFVLTNKTGYEVDQVYVSAASSDDWEEDILGKNALDNGESVNIHFSRGTRGCRFDLKVVYSDDEEAVWKDIDLCTVEKITIRWNRRSGETSATFNTGEEQWYFYVENSTDSKMTKLSASEDGRTWKKFNIGSGIRAGVTTKMIWSSSTNNESCKQYLKAKFADGSISKSRKFNFCKDLDDPIVFE